MTEINTVNDSLVSYIGGDIGFPLGVPGVLPKDRALRMAAWIVAIADQSEDHAEFLALLKAVDNT